MNWKTNNSQLLELGPTPQPQVSIIVQERAWQVRAALINVIILLSRQNRVITRARLIVEFPPIKATLLLSSTDTGRGHHKEMGKAFKIR